MLFFQASVRCFVVVGSIVVKAYFDGLRTIVFSFCLQVFLDGKIINFQ